MLILGSLLLAAADFVWPEQRIDNVTTAVLSSLGFALTPAAAGWLLAKFDGWLWSDRTSRRYYRTWHVAWAVLLFMIAAGRFNLIPWLRGLSA